MLTLNSPHCHSYLIAAALICMNSSCLWSIFIEHAHMLIARYSIKKTLHWGEKRLWLLTLSSHGLQIMGFKVLAWNLSSMQFKRAAFVIHRKLVVIVSCRVPRLSAEQRIERKWLSAQMQPRLISQSVLIYWARRVVLGGSDLLS